MITHLVLDILEFEVKWPSESITMNKVSGGDGIPVELFQILKDDAVKVLHSIYIYIYIHTHTSKFRKKKNIYIYTSKFRKLSSGHSTGKRSVFIPIHKKGNAKECSNYCTIAFISHASKIMLKILQVRLQQYVNNELPDVQAGFSKGRGTRDQIANIHWIIEKARNF